MKGLKKITAIILCVILAVTAIPMCAFAEEEITPYCEIKLKEGFSAEIEPGEPTHIIFDYELGKYEYNCDFKYYVTGGTYERADPNNLAEGIIVKSNSYGKIKVRVIIKSRLADDWDEIIAEDELEITVLDTRTEEEKLKDKFDKFVTEANFTAFFTTFFIILPILLSPITTPIGIIKSVIEIWQLN